MNLTSQMPMFQFNNAGARRQHTIDVPNMNLGKHLIEVFCDNQYLYFLMTEHGYERSLMKKGDETLLLNRWSHADFSYAQFPVAVPSVNSSFTSTFWSFLGQSPSGEKFLLSKGVDPDLGTVWASVASFDSEGKLVGDIVPIIFDMKAKYLRPSRRKDQPFGNRISSEDFEFNESATSVPSNLIYKKDIMVYSTGGYCHILYDAMSDRFYAYGLLGPKRMKDLKNVYDHFYIMTFDRQGKKIGDVMMPISAGLRREGLFKVDYPAGWRWMGLRVLPGGVFNVSFTFGKINFWSTSTKGHITFWNEIANGQIVYEERREDYSAWWNPLLSKTTPLEAQPFIDKHGFMQHSSFLEQWQNTKYEVLIAPAQNNLAAFYYFKRHVLP
jgi:hypothetical protein